MTQPTDNCKIRVQIAVWEKDGKKKVQFDMDEKDATLIDVSLLIHELEYVKLLLLDREYDSEGYEIEQD